MVEIEIGDEAGTLIVTVMKLQLAKLQRTELTS